MPFSSKRKLVFAMLFAVFPFKGRFYLFSQVPKNLFICFSIVMVSPLFWTIGNSRNFQDLVKYSGLAPQIKYYLLHFRTSGSFTYFGVYVLGFNFSCRNQFISFCLEIASYLEGYGCKELFN